MEKEKERGEDGERKAMGKLFRSANKEPLRDHEGNIEWKDPFKSGN